jgi:hypothetical protein
MTRQEIIANELTGYDEEIEFPGELYRRRLL